MEVEKAALTLSGLGEFHSPSSAWGEGYGRIMGVEVLEFSKLHPRSFSFSPHVSGRLKASISYVTFAGQLCLKRDN